MSSNIPSVYPLRDIPVPYRYSFVNKAIRNTSNKRNEVIKNMDRDLTAPILSIIKRTTSSSVRDSEGNLTVKGIDSNTANSSIVENLKHNRDMDNENDGDDELEHDQLEEISHISKKIKLMDENKNEANIQPSSMTASTASNNKISTIDHGGQDVGLIPDDALPLSPIASSGLSSQDEKALDDDNEINEEEKENDNNNNDISYKELFGSTIKSLDPRELQNLAYSLICKLDRSQLTDLNVLIRDNLKRDFITSLPLEIAVKILTKLSFMDIAHCLLVCTSWNKIIHNTPYIWKHLLISESFVGKNDFKEYKIDLKKKYPLIDNVEDVYKFEFLNNCHILKNWYNPDFIPQRTTLRGHMTSVVTCLQFKDGYIITGADDKMIRVYDARTKKFLREFSGHDGGVWALKYDCDGIVVSGSTDRSVRVWDIKRGCCTHVFKGHTSTVRCLDIVEYKGTKYIVTGSRDNTLHVWKLDPSIYARNEDDPEEDSKYPLIFDSLDDNPYFIGVLRGHLASVRTVSGHERIVISGSYDNTLMVWDIIQMKCLYILSGHSDRIYSTIYDHKRNRCISASMDSTIRIWDLKDIWKNGACQIVSCAGLTCTRVTDSYKILNGHTALVGLLKLSDKYLVSAAADGSLKGWDSEDYSRKFAYHHNNLSAITTFCMNDNILVSGSEGQFNIYNLRTGELIHSELLRDAEQIWSVSFKGKILVVAVEKNNQSYIEILDFGVYEPVPTIRI